MFSHVMASQIFHVFAIYVNVYSLTALVSDTHGYFGNFGNDSHGSAAVKNSTVKINPITHL